MIDRSERHRRFTRRLLEAMGLSSLLGLALAGCDGAGFSCPAAKSSVTVTGSETTLTLGCFDATGSTCPEASDPSTASALAAALGVCNAQPTTATNAPCCDVKALSSVVCGPDPSTDHGCCYYAYVDDYGSCGTGRPFVVEGAARTAPLARTASWGAPVKAAAALDPATRDALAAAWARDARGEHASVASFARLALDLLAVGAPADRVRDAQRALGDEIRHAELCFALAGAYAGAPVGPAPLPMDGAMGRTTLAALAAATVTEGCIGETIAALAAAETRDAARDPAAHAALEEIAADEAEHAAGAWRLVAWAHRTGTDEVREAIAAAFAAPALPAGGAAPAGIDEEVFRAHGGMLPGALRALAEQALAEVIRPAAEALQDRGRDRLSA